MIASALLAVLWTPSEIEHFKSVPLAVCLRRVERGAVDAVGV